MCIRDRKRPLPVTDTQAATRVLSMKALFLTLGLLTLPLASQAADGFFKQLTLPSGQVVTVSEGRGEPASTGSYDVRLYSCLLYTSGRPHHPPEQPRLSPV